MFKTQFQIELYICRARQTTELKMKHVGMGKKTTLIQELSPQRMKREQNPDSTHPQRSPQLSSLPNKSITHSAAKHQPSCDTATHCRGTRNAGRCVFSSYTSPSYPFFCFDVSTPLSGSSSHFLLEEWS